LAHPVFDLSLIGLGCAKMHGVMVKRLGRFITFEGIEGCGKSTQHKLFVADLEARGVDCLAVRQPGGTEIGAQIRQILLFPGHHRMTATCETLLYLADRAQHHGEVIGPALDAGRTVVSDRYQDSTHAYQGTARGQAREDLDMLFKLATGGCKPDLTFLLDMDPVVGLARARERNLSEQLEESEGRFEQEALSFHVRIRAAFLEQAREEPKRFIVIDASRELDEITTEIRETYDRWTAALV